MRQMDDIWLPLWCHLNGNCWFRLYFIMFMLIWYIVPPPEGLASVKIEKKEE